MTFGVWLAKEKHYISYNLTMHSTYINEPSKTTPLQTLHLPKTDKKGSEKRRKGSGIMRRFMQAMTTQPPFNTGYRGKRNQRPKTIHYPCTYALGAKFYCHTTKSSLTLMTEAFMLPFSTSSFTRLDAWRTASSNAAVGLLPIDPTAVGNARNLGWGV